VYCGRSLANPNQ
jgi:serine/threonine protein kinase